MNKCDKCKYPYDIRKWPCEDCLQGDRFEQKPSTNADRIRAMSDEELAGFIVRPYDLPGWCETCGPHSAANCVNCWLDWLRQEDNDG